MNGSDPTSDPSGDAIEAAAFRRLLAHLRTRPDAANIELMILAGFCRNCLADWYREAAAQAGLAIGREQARERIYGMPYEDWKARHQPTVTPEQLAKYELAMKLRTKG